MCEASKATSNATKVPTLKTKSRKGATTPRFTKKTKKRPFPYVGLQHVTKDTLQIVDEAAKRDWRMSSPHYKKG